MTRRLLMAVAFFLAVATPLTAQQTVPGTYGDAMRWYRKEAEKGYAPAQFLLGYMYEVGERTAQDLSLAREWYAKAAAQGETRALYRLARLYHLGLGGAADAAEAVRNYRAAAERGHIESQSILGYLYALGEDVSRDDVEAFLWLSLAAEAGDAAAATNLDVLMPDLTPEQIGAGEARLKAWSPQR